MFSARVAGSLASNRCAAKGLKAFGYGALVERFCGITLEKTSQKADWSRRPLSPAMIDYAVQDTEYLEPIAEALGRQLDELKRREWHEQSCARVVEASKVTRTTIRSTSGALAVPRSSRRRRSPS